MNEVDLRRKWTFKAHGAQVVVVKHRIEKTSHVLMKAFLWALHLPQYPGLSIELAIGQRYKPDVIALDASGQPLFWGESGHVGIDKLETLLRRHRDTHFAFAKWETRLDPLAQAVARAVADVRRSAPIDLFNFREDSAERFIAADGAIAIDHADLEWRRIE